jgi:hypothetical protein
MIIFVLVQMYRQGSTASLSGWCGMLLCVLWRCIRKVTRGAECICDMSQPTPDTDTDAGCA